MISDFSPPSSAAAARLFSQKQRLIIIMLNTVRALQPNKYYIRRKYLLHLQFSHYSAHESVYFFRPWEPPSYYMYFRLFIYVFAGIVCRGAG
jgi:hypothetical protein